MSGFHPKDTLVGLARDYGPAIGLAIVIALSIRIFLFEAYRIPSSAMKPALEAGDTIFVSKIKYWKSTPQYGEIIVFSPPTDPKSDYIKRVVALAGDTVEVQNGNLILNGVSRTTFPSPLALCGKEELPGHSYPICREPPLPDHFGPTKVPPGHVFVLGDSRTQIQDARKQKSWGMIPLTSVKAKALWIWLSVDPGTSNSGSGWFSRVRFERMLRRIL